jgi:hypothetical protein
LSARTFGSFAAGVVGAGRAGEKVAARAGLVSRLDHVRVDEDGAQAFHAETLDEAHAAHVGGEVVDFHRAFADAMAVGLDAHVQAEIFHAGHVQIPLVKRLLVHRADVGKTLFLEIKREVAGDESARAGDDDQIILLQGRPFPRLVYFPMALVCGRTLSPIHPTRRSNTLWTFLA